MSKNDRIDSGVKPMNLNLNPAENSANLPAVPTGGFALTTATGLQLPAEIAAELSETDLQGYEAPTDTLPIVSIRQKELRGENGKILFPAGGFMMYDRIAEAEGTQIKDVDGEVGLAVTILGDQTSRVYFQSMESKKPDCRSLDGITGQGTPGGNCAMCSLNQWSNGDRPKCTEQRNLLVYDHNVQGCYVLRLGRSGLSPYNLFKGLLKRTGIRVPHVLKVRVSSAYNAEPAPHFVPVFDIQSAFSADELALLKKMQSLRTEMGVKLAKTVAVDTVDEEHPVSESNLTPGADFI